MVLVFEWTLWNNLKCFHEFVFLTPEDHVKYEIYIEMNNGYLAKDFMINPQLLGT